MTNYFIKIPHTVISSNIASVILVSRKSKQELTEDFLFILNPSEITKTHQKWNERSQCNHENNYNYFRIHIYTS